MKIDYCLSFCEIELCCFSSGYNFERIFDLALKNSGFETVSRIYIGSNFCSQYFLHINPRIIFDWVEYCKLKGINVTLCLPIFTQKDLQKAKEYIAVYSQKFNNGIDEITVNDYGMLNYIEKTYNQMKINIGRLLNKDTRDVRYDDYYHQEFTPALLSLDNNLRDKINYYELDATHSTLNIPEGKKVSLYTPYCYVTVGQMCEYASIDLPIEKKFRPNSQCSANCTKVFTEYHDGSQHSFYKIGRAVFTKNERINIKGINSYRSIYQLFDMVTKL